MSVNLVGQAPSGAVYRLRDAAIPNYVMTATFTAVCGNGVVEAGEQCDDGNATDGDGCSAACLLE